MRVLRLWVDFIAIAIANCESAVFRLLLRTGQVRTLCFNRYLVSLPLRLFDIRFSSLQHSQDRGVVILRRSTHIDLYCC